MKSWLIVLVPIVLFGALLAFDNAKPSPADSAKPAKRAKPAPMALSAPVLAVTPKPTPQPTSPTASAVAKSDLKQANDPSPTIDPVKGTKRVAKLWNEMDVAPLAVIVDKWKDQDLAPILAVMDNSKVVELLSLMSQTKPDRAATLSKELQRLASIVPPQQTVPTPGT